MTTNHFVSLRELEALAKTKMDPIPFQYYRSGANQEVTLNHNMKAFEKIKLNPRVLRDVSQVQLNTKILGRTISMPIGIAPTAMMRLACDEGELIPANLAYELNIPITLSTLSTTKIENVAQANQTGLRFMQLYIQKDRELTKKLVKKAEENNFSAIILTVDAPVLGKREADEKQKFQLPPNLKLEVLEDIAESNKTQLQSVQNDQGSGLLKFFSDQLDQSLTWQDLTWLKSITKLPIILKGIQCWQDALLARQHGVAGVWVSNHGGRQLDTVRASIEILPEVVQVLQGSGIEVYVDGGVRSGSDVFKCLALGASCVFLGRPVLYSIATAQKEGLKKMFSILQNELYSTMQLCGVTSIKEINQDYIITRTIPKPNL